MLTYNNIVVKLNQEERLDYLLNELIKENDEKFSMPIDYDKKRDTLRAMMNVRMPQPISKEFLKIQDDFLTEETNNKTLTTAEMIKTINSDSKLAIWQGDIVTLAIDAIVNACNSRLLGCFIPLHNCIDNIIHSASGIQLRNACNYIMIKQGYSEPVGHAKITYGYNLPSKYVIHTVGPAIPNGSLPTDTDCEKLKSCYLSCLELSNSYDIKSIAFPCISTGVFNFPKEKAAKIAINASKEYLENNPDTNIDKIIFNVFGDDNYNIYQNIIKNMRN
jgi:O-acetyl-ADP-ribose deacetylase (regulator of RNase III)